MTLPRRPRSSWSAPPRDSPTPMGYAMTMRPMRPSRAEPIYDGVGPRTSADGSSMGTLPRCHSNGIKSGPVTPNQQKFSLGPYYAPIAELQECPNTPQNEKKNSANSTANSSSEMTLIEESISSYCEPFGKAIIGPPVHHETTTTPTPLSSSKSRNSTTSAESELEALIIPNGNSHHGNNNKMHEHKLEEDIPPMMPLLPPIMTSGNSAGIAETSFNNGNAEDELEETKKVPPKTLPKPKVRPLPPPKPKKSAMLNRPVIFQDEGADGSEV